MHAALRAKGEWFDYGAVSEFMKATNRQYFGYSGQRPAATDEQLEEIYRRYLESNDGELPTPYQMRKALAAENLRPGKAIEMWLANRNSPHIAEHGEPRKRLRRGAEEDTDRPKKRVQPAGPTGTPHESARLSKDRDQQWR